MNWEARVYHIVNGVELEIFIQYDEWNALMSTIGALIPNTENITRIDIRKVV